MHVDINSCFATIEQQANPFLRGKPVVVAAFTTSKGCILAASVEAKKLGIKTGMRVFEGRSIYPKLVVLPPDPWKYRDIHLKLKRLLLDYSDKVYPKSIDEFALNLRDYLTLKTLSSKDSPCKSIAQEIKWRIKKEIGDWITVSIGIAPNRYLAKVAAGLQKPDGLTEINKENFRKVYSKMKLTDLTGIKERNAARLNCLGIFSVMDFYEAPVWRLRAAFHSITGLYWHLRLSGYEIDDFGSVRGTFGNSVALGKNLSGVSELSPILSRLTDKMAGRLRAAGYKASGVHLTVIYKNGNWWHKGRALRGSYFDTRDLYKAAFRLLQEASPSSPVLNLAVSCFGLTKDSSLQLNFFEDIEKKKSLVEAIDSVNKKWGDFSVGMGKGFSAEKMIQDRIAFGIPGVEA
jgi:DNA polymerase-4